MTQLHLRAMQWAEDGELVSADRVSLLTILMSQSVPEVQMELIHCLECLPLEQREHTAQVSES